MCTRSARLPGCHWRVGAPAPARGCEACESSSTTKERGRREPKGARRGAARRPSSDSLVPERRQGANAGARRGRKIRRRRGGARADACGRAVLRVTGGCGGVIGRAGGRAGASHGALERDAHAPRKTTQVRALRKRNPTHPQKKNSDGVASHGGNTCGNAAFSCSRRPRKIYAAAPFCAI